jgi:small ligand-binding sensory domain FIST
VRWAAAISEHSNLERAIDEAGAEASRALAGVKADLVFVFVSPRESYDLVPRAIGRLFPGAAIVGCTGSGIIGAGREIEERHALSIVAAELPGVKIAPFHLERWQNGAPIDSSMNAPHFVLLSDPFSFDAIAFVKNLDLTFPLAKKIGGLASGGRGLLSNALFVNDRVYRNGMAAVALDGNLVVDTIVAQGCKPIGEPMLITRCEDNVIFELGAKPPLVVLQEVFSKLEDHDGRLLAQSLFLGIEMKDQVEYKAGDFLIRNIVGIDRKHGGIAVGAAPKQWQAVQFHIRDAGTSREDLARLLDRHRKDGSSPAGALLFSCLGRGEHLYGAPNHDSELFLDRFPNTPIGGFFCNGEIGPVGGTTFLHGYTSSFGLVREKK